MTTAQPIRDGSHDFDFFLGKWKSHNYRLRERLVGCTEWIEFEGTSEVRTLLGGEVNFDEVVWQRENGTIHGITFRLYDQKTGQWRLYWAATGSGYLDIPMIGSFDEKNGTGKFYAHEPHNGKYIYSRYVWSNITPTSVRWEQAFSPDGGATWETNLTTEFTRIES